MIQLRNLRVVKGRQPICRVSALDVTVDQKVALFGGNGSGKSTLLRVLAGMERNYSGQCTINVPPKDVCYVHQSPYLFRGSVLDNVVYGMRVRGVDRLQRENQAKEALQRFDLAHRASDQAKQLSGGETRRVAILRAMLTAPSLLLLDEPFADMDETGAEQLLSLLSDLQGTIVWTSPTRIEAAAATRAISISSLH